MVNEGMDLERFDRLICLINQETSSNEKKVCYVNQSRGYFTPLQAARLLYQFPRPTDKLKILEVLEARLCRMTCSEARDIIGTLSINNDKLTALSIIKRYLVDCQTREGRETILNCFPFDFHKHMAQSILHTVRSDVFDVMPVGGHQLYSAMGGLFGQSRPLLPNLFGSIYEQKLSWPSIGKLATPTLARLSVLPSRYTGHPSYAYPRGQDYAQAHGYPGCQVYTDEMYRPEPRGRECPAKYPLFAHYPAGAPPLWAAIGSATPVAFQTTTCYN